MVKYKKNLCLPAPLNMGHGCGEMVMGEGEREPTIASRARWKRSSCRRGDTDRKYQHNAWLHLDFQSGTHGTASAAPCLTPASSSQRAGMLGAACWSPQPWHTATAALRSGDHAAPDRLISHAWPLPLAPVILPEVPADSSASRFGESQWTAQTSSSGGSPPLWLPKGLL